MAFFVVFADRCETQPLAERYASVVPAEGSVVDMLVRARDKQTGQCLRPHQIVAQVSFWYSLVSGTAVRAPLSDCFVVQILLRQPGCLRLVSFQPHGAPNVP
jgi:hypothetical protein